MREGGGKEEETEWKRLFEKTKTREFPIEVTNPTLLGLRTTGC